MTTLQNDEQSLRVDPHKSARGHWNATQQWYKLTPDGTIWRRLGEKPMWNSGDRYAMLGDDGALHEFAYGQHPVRVSDYSANLLRMVPMRTDDAAEPTPPAQPALPRLSDGQVGGTHYKDMAVSPFDEIKALLTRAEWLGFLKGNYLKYKRRAGLKGDAAQDEAKAQHYWEVLQREQAEGVQS